jgi:hypothetical protein
MKTAGIIFFTMDLLKTLYNGLHQCFQREEGGLARTQEKKA